MTSLIAKPILKNQYWVVTDGDKKVGNVISNGSGYEVKLNGNLTYFNDHKDIQRKVNIRFQPMKSNRVRAELPYPEFPTTSRTYNNIFDIKRRLHLFTKSKNSKCYHAAGWFVMNQIGIEQIAFCPKYIFIQRYQYKGPFKTEEEAKSQINIS